MDHLPAFAWIKDRQGRYLYYNKMVAEIPELRSEALGKDDLELWPRAIANHYRANDRKVISSGKPLQTIEPFLTKEEPRSLLVTKFPIFDHAGKVVMVGGTSIDITDRLAGQQAVQELTNRLLKAQSEERRRIARDLHDSTVQKLAVLVMELGRLRDETSLNREVRPILRDCTQLAEACSEEVRTLSYALHPPLLDELGLAAALRSYIQGFCRQTQMEVTLKAPRGLPKLSVETGLALFRVVQESLTNVLRHSGSSKASVELKFGRPYFSLTVRDWGHGLPPKKLKELKGHSTKLGVGFRSMHERLQHLGGRLEISSGHRGTMVRATVRVPSKIKPATHAQ